MPSPRDLNDSDNGRTDVPFPHSFTPGEYRNVMLNGAKVDEYLQRANVTEAAIKVEIREGPGNTFISNPLNYTTESSDE